MMTTIQTTSAARATTGLLPIVFTALFGASLVFLSGFAHSRTIHDAAHDMRHSTGFPCH
jgi:cobalt transporter subunit CbtB